MPWDFAKIFFFLLKLLADFLPFTPFTLYHFDQEKKATEKKDTKKNIEYEVKRVRDKIQQGIFGPKMNPYINDKSFFTFYEELRQKTFKREEEVKTLETFAEDTKIKDECGKFRSNIKNCLCVF